MLNKKLLIKEEVKDIALSFAIFAGVIPGQDVWDDFVKDRMGDIKNKEKIRLENLTALAKDMQAVLPDQKVSPSNKPLRSNIRDIVDKLVTFTKEYNTDGRYSPEVMIEASRKYGLVAKGRDFEMVSPLNFFIIKNNQSSLADYCESILSNKGGSKGRNYSSSDLI